MGFSGDFFTDCLALLMDISSYDNMQTRNDNSTTSNLEMNLGIKSQSLPLFLFVGSHTEIAKGQIPDHVFFGGRRNHSAQWKKKRRSCPRLSWRLEA